MSAVIGLRDCPVHNSEQHLSVASEPEVGQYVELIAATRVEVNGWYAAAELVS